MQIKQITLARTPQGTPSEHDFEFGDATLPAPAGGQALVRVLALSLDPYLRSAMAGRHLSAAIRPGEVVRGEGLVQVLASQHPRLAPGTTWVAACGWRSHALLDADAIEQARPVGPELQPATLALGVLGMPGLTAWAGFKRLADAKAGDTLVVSAASGPVGATVGQLARLAGCRVIGIAGGPEKCAWVTGQAGFDACIDYHAEDLRQALRRLAPQGVAVYFDNVGGDVLLAVCEQLAVGARIVLCGLMAQYNGAAPVPLNPGLIIRARATVRGLVVYDHWADFAEMTAEIGAHIRAGQLQFREDISHGLASTPSAFARLMNGRNQGKALVVL
ncbi:MAG: NADP-dependent oxidoreductase [Rubrivivax sp.]|nr:NADP-dependent oxidoreductase [Rubrivivax sp.]